MWPSHSAHTSLASRLLTHQPQAHSQGLPQDLRVHVWFNTGRSDAVEASESCSCFLLFLFVLFFFFFCFCFCFLFCFLLFLFVFLFVFLFFFFLTAAVCLLVVEIIFSPGTVMVGDVEAHCQFQGSVIELPFRIETNIPY